MTGVSPHAFSRRSRGVLRLCKLHRPAEHDKCFHTPVTMGISNHKATLWAWFNLAVFCVCVCVYVKGKPPKYGPKELLILRRILKTFKCTSIRLSSPTQQQHRHIQTASTGTPSMNGILKGWLLAYFTGKYCPPSSWWQRTPQTPQLELLRLRQEGKRKKTQQSFPPARHETNWDRPKSHTHGTQEQLWCTPFLVVVMAKMFLTQHIKLLIRKYGKGKLHVTGYFRSI